MTRNTAVEVLEKWAEVYLRKFLGKAADKFFAKVNEDPYDRLTTFGFDIGKRDGRLGITTINGEFYKIKGRADIMRIVKRLVQEITIPNIA